MLKVLYRDEHIVAINKPNGLIVHKTSIATHTDTFAVQELRNQLKQHVYPVHRLDRKTSGVLLFALDPKLVAPLQAQFAESKVSKTYWAILRGWTADEDLIDYPLTNDSGKTQEAVTAYKTLEKTEIDLPFGKHTTSRYSLVEAYPKTGRMHQLRKHFAHILHPIIGDRPHGCNKQNKLFLEKWRMATMLLHARYLEIKHPVFMETVKLEASLNSEFERMLTTLKFDYAFS